MPLSIPTGPPIQRGWSNRREVASHVHPDDVVPLIVGHIEDHSIAQDAGGVHHDVESSERINRLFDEPFANSGITDIVVNSNGAPTTIGNGTHEVSNQMRIGIVAVGVHARIVHDNVGAQ
jgi:hypothetical protein